MSKKKMSFEEYCQISNMLKDIRELIYKYPRLPPKKSTHWKYKSKIDKEIDTLRSHLEELMFLDCPEQINSLRHENEPIGFSRDWATHIFFDCSKRVDPINKIIYDKEIKKLKTE